MMKENYTEDNKSMLQNKINFSLSSAFCQNCPRPVLKAPIHLYSNERDNVKKLIQLEALEYNPLHDYTQSIHSYYLATVNFIKCYSAIVLKPTQ
jgi:hypothetical protein